MKFTLLRTKNLIEKTDDTLQHMHDLFFSHWNADNLENTAKIRLCLQYCVFFNCSIVISAWLYVVQDNPCQEHLISGRTVLTTAFLPSTISLPFSREAHTLKWSKICASGIIMAACSFYLFHQNTTNLCVLHGWMRIHHSPGVEHHATKMQSATMFLACICDVDNVDWIVLYI